MHVSCFEYKLTKKENIQIALVAFERQRNYSEVASILYDEYKSYLQGVDIIIVRPPVDIQVTDLEEETRSSIPIINRFSHLPIYLLTSTSYIISLSDNINGDAKNYSIDSIDKEELILHIRQKELEQFVLHSSAIIRSPPNTIFRTPSQEFSHSFLRVGSIQTNKHVLDTLFFWCIPYLKEAGSILTDSWTISSTALNIARLLNRYDNSVKATDFHVNMLTSHYYWQKSIDRETEYALFNLTYGNTKKILFLLSAIKTQKSLQYLQRLLSNLPYSSQLNYLAIFKLIDSINIESLCELGSDFQKKNSISFDTFSDPPVKDSVIEIDEKVFFPYKVEETQITITKMVADTVSVFFREYEGKGVIFIHRDSYYLNKDRFRHHGIYIDVSKMLNCESFLNKVKSQIEVIEKQPDLIIYPPHEHGKDLVNVIKSLLINKFGDEPQIVSILDLHFLSKPEHDSLSNKIMSLNTEATIMIVDDVSVTGSRLKAYQKKLRNLFKGQIHYFIGVARPHNEAEWLKREKDLIYRGRMPKHKVTYIEKIILPDWDNKDCPWCCEEEILQKVISNPDNKQFPLTKSLYERYRNLDNSKERGLMNDVFYSINKNEKPTFKGGSIFAEKKEISEADLTAIIACVMQHLRTVGIKNGHGENIKLENNYPHKIILRIGDFLSENSSFNEALIKAAILRTSYRNELHAASQANRQIQMECVSKLFGTVGIEKDEISFFIYELYLALKERKLPKPDVGKTKLIQLLEQAFDKIN